MLFSLQLLAFISNSYKRQEQNFWEVAHLYANGGLELNWKLLFFNDSNGDSRVSFECQLFVLQIILSILKKKNNNKCGSLSHIIIIYAVSSGLCREATQRDVLRRRSTTQADSITKISFCCEISLRKQPASLDATSGFFAKRRRNKVCRLLSFPVLMRKFTN